ncbi:MAG: hypothetical protein M0D53_02850 [Flavobacterium sp. JAD_PAG50586_2]|nr:MAG: hypothetical protein M0D53_02850 [Flavobacterium sp. JAD_PAG50586_2]
MKKLYILLLFLSAFANAQIVNIPDANFKSILLSAESNNSTAQNALGQAMRIDTNTDGEIQLSEALVVAKLSLYGPNISNLTGLASFSNLTFLDCSNEGITSLTLTNLPFLKDFYIGFAGPSPLQVISIDLNGVLVLKLLPAIGLRRSQR